MNSIKIATQSNVGTFRFVYSLVSQTYTVSNVSIDIPIVSWFDESRLLQRCQRSVIHPLFIQADNQKSRLINYAIIKIMNERGCLNSPHECVSRDAANEMVGGGERGRVVITPPPPPKKKVTKLGFWFQEMRNILLLSHKILSFWDSKK